MIPVVVCAASLASWGLVFALRRWLVRVRAIDIPNERSSHETPTPRGGGLAIVGVTIGGVFAAKLLRLAPLPLHALTWYLAGGAVLAAVSWLDDLRPMSAKVRLAVHGVVAGVAVLTIGYWNGLEVPMAGRIEIGGIGLLLSLVWVVGLTNAYNFMDGIDGIAAGQAVVGGVAWSIMGHCCGETQVMFLGLLIASSSLGFLAHNWPPARIFMGDVGSAFLGFSFAVLALIRAPGNPRLASTGVLLMWPFILDTSFTFLRRLLRGENVFAAHRSHLYQRLVIAGYSHQFVALLYLLLASVGAILTIGWTLRPDAFAGALVLFLCVESLGLVAFVHRMESKRKI